MLYLFQLEVGWALGAEKQAQNAQLSKVQENRGETTDLVERICLSIVHLGDMMLVHWHIHLLIEVGLSSDGLGQ